MKEKIGFFKTLKFDDRSTEHMALEVLNNPKYDDCKYVDKNEIEKAFDEYGYKLNPFNANTYSSLMDSPHIEGHFLKANLPEVESIVFDDICNIEYLHRTMDLHPDITHLALSTYAMAMDNTIEVVKEIRKEYPDKEIILGGIGVLFPYLKKYVDPDHMCYEQGKGNGVNWLRKFFNLKPYSKEEYRIPIIVSNRGIFNITTAYLVTQIGCPYGCDFCITPSFLKYVPLANSSKKIINILEKMRNKTDEDIFLFLCDPNALFPVKVWKEVFDYYIENNQGNKIFLFCLVSLNHLRLFNLEVIQQKSALKFLMINFGIESVLSNYEKNKGVTNDSINHINNLGIATFHNFILGLLFHTKQSINIEIERNLAFDSTWFSVNTLKPLPTTKTYIELKKENRIFGEDLPPEFLYREGFFPFQHKYLGGGFSALKYAFKAYYDCERKSINSYSRLVEIVDKLPIDIDSSFIKALKFIFRDLSRKNYNLIHARMPSKFVDKYQENFEIVFSEKI
ncbi:MAG: B12-binding domain-containing radical SAM protein [Candidatus Odinarchaeota archaeon]